MRRWLLRGLIHLLPPKEVCWLATASVNALKLPVIVQVRDWTKGSGTYFIEAKNLADLREVLHAWLDK